MQTQETTRDDLIAEGKALAEKCRDYVEKLRAGASDGQSPALTLDQRWVGIGAVDLQRGFMALRWSIEMPDSF